MRVKELSDRSGVASHVIRYYSRLGLLHPRRERANGYRAYAEADVYRVRFIRRARRLGFSLQDVELILGDADRGESPCPEVRRLIAQRAWENRRRLEALTELQQRMESAISRWARMPDQLPDHRSLCHLIDIVAEADPLLT
jgi:DNA-binding transcriptional MerR regulator